MIKQCFSKLFDGLVANGSVCDLQPSSAVVAGSVAGVLALAALGVGLGVGLRDNDDSGALSAHPIVTSSYNLTSLFVPRLSAFMNICSCPGTLST